MKPLSIKGFSFIMEIIGNKRQQYFAAQMVAKLVAKIGA